MGLSRASSCSHSSASAFTCRGASILACTCPHSCAERTSTCKSQVKLTKRCTSSSPTQGPGHGRTWSNDTTLFFALRGGGGSTWGVVTSLTIRTHDNQPGGFMSISTVWAGLLATQFDTLEEVTDTYLAWSQSLGPKWSGLAWFTPIKHMKDAAVGMVSDKWWRTHRLDGSRWRWTPHRHFAADSVRVLR